MPQHRTMGLFGSKWQMWRHKGFGVEARAVLRESGQERDPCYWEGSLLGSGLKRNTWMAVLWCKGRKCSYFSHSDVPDYFSDKHQWVLMPTHIQVKYKWGLIPRHICDVDICARRHYVPLHQNPHAEAIRNILAVRWIFLCCTGNHRQLPKENGAEQHTLFQTHQAPCLGKAILRKVPVALKQTDVG